MQKQEPTIIIEAVDIFGNPIPEDKPFLFPEHTLDLIAQGFAKKIMEESVTK